MGSDYNWKMIFGKNKALWWLPITTGEGAPLGDGVVINRIEQSFSNFAGGNADNSDFDDIPDNRPQYNDPLNQRNDRIGGSHHHHNHNPLDRDICKFLLIVIGFYFLYIVYVQIFLFGNFNYFKISDFQCLKMIYI